MLVRFSDSLEVAFFVQWEQHLPGLQMRLMCVRPHELPEHFRRSHVLQSASFYESFSEIAVDTDSKADIFSQHVTILPCGYTNVYPICMEDTFANEGDIENMDLFQNQTSPAPFDQGLTQVRDFLLAKPDLLGIVGRAIRRSFDEVIDGPRTGRFCIEQLEKTEKTYIGTKVEIILRSELSLERGQILDNMIFGHEVDTKFTVGSNWMIPREALGQLCLLVTGNDHSGRCAMGILRMVPEVLTIGANQDGKKSVSKSGKSQITWLVDGPMPRNFMLDLPDVARTVIMTAPSGRQAIWALFRNATGRLIPRAVIEQVAQQKDAAKRARESKQVLAAEGIQVLCATYMEDRAEFVRHGFTQFNDDDWLSMPTR